MQRARLFGVFCLALLLGPLLFAQALQDPPQLDAQKRLKDIWKKVDRDQPAKDVIHSLETMEQIQVQMSSITTGTLWMQLVSHRDPDVRARIARTMADVVAVPMDSAPRVASKLIECLNDRDNGVRAACLFALGRLGPHAKPAIPRAIKEMKNGDPRIRRGAVALLGNRALDEKELIPHIISAIDDPDAEWEKERGHNSVSMLAMRSLKLCKSDAKAAAPKLVQIVEKKKFSDSYQLWALITLIAVDPDHPLPLKIGRECIKRKDQPDQLSKGFTLLGELAERGNPAMVAISDLLEVLKMPALPDADLERGIKSGALSVFQRMGPAAKDALPFLRAMPARQDPDMFIYVDNAIKSIEGRKE